MSYEKKNAIIKAIDKVVYSNKDTFAVNSFCGINMWCFKLGTNIQWGKKIYI